MNYTPYYKLQKDLTIEKYDVNVVNMNSDIIDSALHRLDLKNQTQDDLFATKDALNQEALRAATKENEIEKKLDSEISMINVIENELVKRIEAEENRAIDTEIEIDKALSNHVADDSNPHHITKEQVGLSNVDNTSDINKPVSTSQKNAIDQAVADHNISTVSHNDIRRLVTELTTRLNTLADSDDTTLDQLSEIVAYIKNNKSLIDSITTSKVNVADVIDNLTSTATNKPLSANQGKILNELIADLTDVINNIEIGGTSSNDYTDDDKEIVWSFKNMTREEALNILNEEENSKELNCLLIVSPTKKSYVQGESLDLSDIIVVAHYTSGDDKNVTEFATFSPANGTLLNTVGEQVITITYTEGEITKTASISIIVESASQIVPFADATDEELADLLDSHYKGELNLADHWHVGDERVVHLSAMENWNTNSTTIIMGQNTFGESQPAQDVTLVIIDFNVDTLRDSINGCTKAAITVQLKQCLSNLGIIDGDYAVKSHDLQTIDVSWAGCDRRQWCNDTFKNSLPSQLRNLVKLVQKSNPHLYAYGNGSKYTIDHNNFGSQGTLYDYCFLLTNYEISREGANTTNPFDDSVQYEYFKISDNKTKTYRWWLRGMTYSGSGDNCGIGWTDYPGSQFMYNNGGIVPAFCL